MPSWYICGNERFRGPVFSAASVGYSTEAQQFFTRLANDPGTTRKNLYAALIDGLVSAGVWSLLDVLHIYAADTAGNAVINLKSSSYTANPDTPTFTANTGYSFPTGAESINTMFVPSTAVNFQQNAASLGIWCVVCPASIATLVRDNAGGGSTDIYPRYTADDKLYTRVNDTTFDGAVIADGTGFLLGVRSSSTARETFRNGSSTFSNNTTNSVAREADVVLMTGIATAQVAAFCAGGNITSAQSTLYTLLRTYMTGVGVP